ncbi:hypothetical protein SAMN02910436_02106 [Ruminococcaceae bacterium P7]|nr:hypothetical protein SAMN02910436_02106 [Ruminococcaceae bacterium P7]
MNALPEGESKEKVLEHYNFLRNHAGFIQTNAYKKVREWFVEQFPLYRKDPLFYLKNEVKVIEIKAFTEQADNKGA